MIGPMACAADPPQNPLEELSSALARTKFIHGAS